MAKVKEVFELITLLKDFEQGIEKEALEDLETIYLSTKEENEEREISKKEEVKEKKEEMRKKEENMKKKEEIRKKEEKKEHRATDLAEQRARTHARLLHRHGVAGPGRLEQAREQRKDYRVQALSPLHATHLRQIRQQQRALKHRQCCKPHTW